MSCGEVLELTIGEPTDKGRSALWCWRRAEISMPDRRPFGLAGGKREPPTGLTHLGECCHPLAVFVGGFQATKIMAKTDCGRRRCGHR